jgi:hypothetical protein
METKKDVAEQSAAPPCSADFVCEFCRQEQKTLYEGWFRTAAAFNPYAKGTASAGLLQLRRACNRCAEEAVRNGVACATEVPSA